MTPTYTRLDLNDCVTEAPPDGILSRTVFDDDRLKVVLFAFASGQELSEHTASVPAIIQVLQGNARLTLGEDEMAAREGTWIHMPARLPHSVLARTPLTMLLLMLINQAPAPKSDA